MKQIIFTIKKKYFWSEPEAMCIPTEFLAE